jgi:alkaline phosphatase
MNLLFYNSYNKRILICFILVLNLFSIGTFAQERKYTVSNGHAHNDYNHPVPFYTAYNAGFGSIEADIILKNHQLYVAHDTIDITSKKTLQSLYLDPLQKVIQKNKGHVYTDSLKNLLLLIDLKTPAEPTLETFLQVLQHYKMITGCLTLKIVITGNQPDVSRLTSYPSYIFFDGDLNKNYTIESLNKVALFSDNFRNYTSWNGEGFLVESDREKIKRAVTKSHTLNKPIRFWAAPDLPNAWYQLMSLNVDYINTDKIHEISAFLNKLSSNSQGQ